MGFRSALCVVVLTCACRPADVEPDDTGMDDELPEVASGSAVGPEGAIVAGGEGAEGAEIEIPPGALTEDVVITLEAVGSGYPDVPAVAGSPVIAFEPHGLVFEEPVTIRLPHDLTPGEAVMWTAQPGGAWEKLRSTDLGAFTEVEVLHFSFFFNGREVCGLDRQECCVAPDVACAGSLLECVSITGTGPGTCMPCGLIGEPCCGETTCAAITTQCDVDTTALAVCLGGTCNDGCPVPSDTGSDTGSSDTGSSDTGDTSDSG